MLSLGLERIASLLTRLESQTIRVAPRQCARVRHRRATCARCIDVCPTNAITWRDTLQIEATQCVNCGICATVCPAGAIEAQSPTNAELLEQIKCRLADQRAIQFACPRYLEATHTPAASVIPIKCLGRLDESILLGAIANGALSVRLLDGVCADCPTAAGRAVAAQSLETTNMLLAAREVSSDLAFDARRLADAKPASPPVAAAEGVSRRAFFDLLAHRTTQATALTMSSMLAAPAAPSDAPPEPGSALATQVPIRRELGLAIWRQIGKPVAGEIENRHWAQFGFNEKCNGCQMCAFFCPTGALQKITQDGKAGVTFRAAICTNCQLCQDVCHLGAVTLTPTVNPAKISADVVETFLMRDAGTAAWELKPEERLQQTLRALFTKE